MTTAQPIDPALILQIRENHRMRRNTIRQRNRSRQWVDAQYQGVTGLLPKERDAVRAAIAAASNGADLAATDLQSARVRPDDGPSAGGGDQSVVALPGQGVSPAGESAALIGATFEGNPEERAKARKALMAYWRAHSAEFLRREAFIAQHTALVAAQADQLDRQQLRDGLDPVLERLARQLPVWPWWAAIRGCNALSLAQVIGEAGDLGNYPKPGEEHKSGVACLWKRMGLAVVDDGTRQRRVAGDAAIEHGYDAERHSVMFVIGTGLMMQNDGEYRAAYDERKEHTRETHPEWTPKHRDFDARRYAAKRLLRDLWRAWRDRITPDLPGGRVPPDATDRAAD
jgi:hypothetical protein